jgi:hypothetical protein
LGGGGIANLLNGTNLGTKCTTLSLIPAITQIESYVCTIIKPYNIRPLLKLKSAFENDFMKAIFIGIVHVGIFLPGGNHQLILNLSGGTVTKLL